MPKINEANDVDLRVIEELSKLGWKRGDTLLYQQEHALTPEQQKIFEGKKSIKPDITLTDINHNILAVFENKFEDEKKPLQNWDHFMPLFKTKQRKNELAFIDVRLDRMDCSDAVRMYGARYKAANAKNS